MEHLGRVLPSPITIMECLTAKGTRSVASFPGRSHRQQFIASFLYWKRWNAGGGNGLGTRLPVVIRTCYTYHLQLAANILIGNVFTFTSKLFQPKAGAPHQQSNRWNSNRGLLVNSHILQPLSHKSFTKQHLGIDKALSALCLHVCTCSYTHFWVPIPTHLKHNLHLREFWEWTAQYWHFTTFYITHACNWMFLWPWTDSQILQQNNMQVENHYAIVYSVHSHT